MTSNSEYTILSDNQITYIKKGFSVTLSQSGTQSLHSDIIEDFLPMIEQSSLTWVDFIVEDIKKNAAKIAETLGFTTMLINRLMSKPRSGYEDFKNEMGLLLPAMRVSDTEVITVPILMLLRENLILTIHPPEITRFEHLSRYAENILRKLPQSLKQTDWLTIVLIRLIEENISKNFEQLQEIDENSDILSQELSTTKFLPSDLTVRLPKMKHALVQYISYLWAMFNTLSSLRYGDADLLSDENSVLDRIGSLIKDVRDQIGLAEHLSEVFASGLECLQSIYNNRLQVLNNRLSVINNRVTFLVGWLTIIGTALLVPNTIATVVSQTNIFTFTPEHQGWYLIVILGSTIISTFAAWLWVKSLGLMPKRKGEDEGIIPTAEMERDE